MPRDLLPRRPAEEASSYKGAEQETPERSDEAGDADGYNRFTLSSNSYNKTHLSEGMKKAEKRNDLHPYVTTLSLDDVESCVKLEEATFPEHERCSREKVRPMRISEHGTSPIPQLSLDLSRRELFYNVV